MADHDPIGEHDKPDEGMSKRPDENIPLSPGGAIGEDTWEPEREQETSFGGMSLRMKVLREHVEALYHVLSENLGKSQKHFI